MTANTSTLTKDNYQEYEDLSIFPTNELVSFFTSLPKVKTLNILRDFDQNFILRFLDDSPEHLSIQWKSSLKFKSGTVGELMQPAALVLNENETVEDAITKIKTIHKQKLFTYGMVVDDANVVTGVLVFKDVFYHEPNEKIKNICFKNPIYLDAEADILETYNKIASEQIPEFPVVDSERKLLGTLRGKHIVDAYALKLVRRAA